MTKAHEQAASALRTLVRQTVVAGAPRRAALLHMDRMPPLLAKPHHQRLARTAMAGLNDRDHAQSFELSHGRLAIVWRSRTSQDADGAMEALQLLLADLPHGQSVPLGQLMSLFDLPGQAPWLLDSLGGQEPPISGGGGSNGAVLDPALLVRLEDDLMQANVAEFLRWRPVISLERGAVAIAWEERFVSLPDLAACLCPGRHLQEGSFLFRRLGRSIERRLLAALTGPRELAGNRPFSIPVSVAGILSPGFVAFDAALPAALRGHVILSLDATDILAGAASFSFARNFAHARGYRLMLQSMQAGLLDPDAAGLDLLEMRLSPELLAAPERLPDRAKLVLSHVDDAAQLTWARAQGCLHIKGMAAQS